MATHSCDVGYGLSGGTERTCQSDRTWSGEIITCKGASTINWPALADTYQYCLFNADIICPSLPDHPYGDITYSPDDTPSYFFGTSATYSTVCPEDFERNGGDDVRTCTGEGNSPVGVWNGSAPVCTGISRILHASL